MRQSADAHSDCDSDSHRNANTGSDGYPHGDRYSGASDPDRDNRAIRDSRPRHANAHGDAEDIACCYTADRNADRQPNSHARVGW